MLTSPALVALGALLAAAALWGWRRVWSFRAQRLEDYAGEGPEMDIRTALAGRLVAEGAIHDYTGRLNTRFVAEMEGLWDGGKGVLTERFRYSSGRAQRREWTIVMGADGAFEATAPDIVGVGRGRQAGCAARLEYRLRLDAEAGGHVLDVVDWMYLLENGTILNRSEFRKFGVRVAELTATMRKAE